jgi:hypothetical protein
MTFKLDCSDRDSRRPVLLLLLLLLLRVIIPSGTDHE